MRSFYVRSALALVAGAVVASGAFASETAPPSRQAAAPQEYRDMMLASAKFLGMLPGLLRTCHPQDKSLFARTRRVLDETEARFVKDFGAQAHAQYRAAFAQGQEMYRESMRAASPERIREMCQASLQRTAAMVEDAERSMGLSAKAAPRSPAEAAPLRNGVQAPRN